MSVIALMGSGELSPTMVATHRSILENRPGPVTFIDTPFGFQENADELTAKVRTYFETSLATSVNVATMRSAQHATPADVERMLDQVRSASYLFSGPGSPSYALAHWEQVELAEAVLTCLRHGGAITLASAAAITAGSHAVPVYEIYKVGADPHWLPGLDVLGSIGVNVAVIPHFNNAEGGTHDTRFCYLGERRLNQMIEQLPATTGLLGIDEHTGLVLDTDRATGSVTGKGQVTFMHGDSITTWNAGDRLDLSALQSSAPRSRSVSQPASLVTFEQAIAMGDAALATNLILAEPDTDAQRTMIVRLGTAAATGLADPATTIGPLVDALINLRDAARADARWDDGDAIRRVLDDYGIVVTDTPGETTWSLG